MTLATVYVAGFLMGWGLKLITFRREAVWAARQDTQWSREWRARHNLDSRE